MLWEVPLSAEDKAITQAKVDKKHQRLLTFTPNEDGLLLIQWDYNQQKKLSQQLLKGKQGRLSVVVVNVDLQTIYLRDQAGVYVMNYSGKQQHTMIYPQDSVAKQWNKEEQQSIASCYEQNQQCLMFFTKDGSKMVLQGGRHNPTITEIINVADGRLLRRFSLLTKPSGRFFNDYCKDAVGQGCLFSLAKNLSTQGDFLMNKREVLDTETEASLIKLTGEVFSMMGADKNGETLLVSRSVDERQLTLWKIKKRE
jgi:hypothetical protein